MKAKGSYILPVGVLLVAAALYVAFVYGYPRMFPAIDESNRNNFEQNVQRAFRDGDFARAEKIARRALKDRYIEPDEHVIIGKPAAYTMLGWALLKSGKTEEALLELNNALNVEKEPLPPFRVTRKPYYYAPARMSLGQYYLEQGDSLHAAANFELARAYAAPLDAEFAEFKSALYQAYVSQGLWARAIEVAEPSDAELDALDDSALLRIGLLALSPRVSDESAEDDAQRHSYSQKLDLARRVSERLVSRGALIPDARYLQARALLAQGQYHEAAAALAEVTSTGRHHAAFYLGFALEELHEVAQAIQSYLNTPSGDVYRPFALAKAFLLLETLPPDQQAGIGRSPQGVLDLLDAEIASLRRSQPLVAYQQDGRLTPVAYAASRVAGGDVIPVLILWQDSKAAPTNDSSPRLIGPDYPEDMILKRNDLILQLQWAANKVNWDSVECLKPGSDTVPGWIDTARDWFKLRPDSAAQIKSDADGQFLAINKMTWFYSAPARIKDGAGYLIAGRIKAPRDKAALAWVAADEQERVVFDETVPAQNSPDSWTWQAGYVHSQFFWETLRVQLQVMPRAGEVSFDDVMLLEINAPPN